MDTDKEEPLRDDTRLLGRVLGEVIAATRGAEGFDVVEATRQAAVAYRRADLTERAAHAAALDARLHALPIERVLDVVRAFSYFSHLANIAEAAETLRYALVVPLRTAGSANPHRAQLRQAQHRRLPQRQHQPP